jgi:dihydroceramide fatty acyl 2-hydroxylase
VVEVVATFALGLFIWTFAEYAIHGWLGHTLTGRAAALHVVHHRDPHAVFTIGAWVPLVVLWTTALVLFGFSSWIILFSGMITGFAIYEYVHYHIHFHRPVSSIDGYLRARHLMHHRGQPDRYFGVTSPLWDLIFASEPSSHAELPVIAPLTGRTNVRLLLSFHYLYRLKAGNLTSNS